MKAVILKGDMVINVIVVDPDRYNGSAIQIGDLPVTVGDTYDGTDFWRGGEKVTPPPDPTAEYIEALRVLGVEV